MIPTFLTTEQNTQIIESVLRHANDELAQKPPREACGLLLRIDGNVIYRACRNIASRAQDFVIDPEDFAQAEDDGEIIAVAHSHMYLPPDPSPADLTGLAESELPWLIVSVPLGHWRWCYPAPYVAPLKGRNYCYGVHDCWTLVRDYYAQELGIQLPRIHAEAGWAKRGDDLFHQYMEACGFVELPAGTTPMLHDVIGMRVRLGEPASHLGVMSTPDRMLHHATNQVSGEVLYGGSWRELTMFVARHQSMMEPNNG